MVCYNRNIQGELFEIMVQKYEASVLSLKNRGKPLVSFRDRP